MKTALLTSPNKLMIVVLISLSGFACQKEVVRSADDTQIQINTVSLSESRVKLLQGNAGYPALTVNWQTNATACGKAGNYIIEMALDGSNFEDKLEITTTGTRVDFNTDELNRQLCKLIPPGTTAKIALRVKACSSQQNNAQVYSEPVGVWVTTYQEFHEYTYPQFMKIPGNYENWILPAAPQIVSEKNDGEYEGFIQFSNAYPQFLMVKGTQWTTLNTFEYIGNNKFGFNGSIFSIFGGAGVYLMKASTNTNTWSYTKINNWTLNGSAVPGDKSDPELIFDSETQTWSATTVLQKGEFRIRANKDDKNSLGQKTVNGYMVPATDGSNFMIEKPGKYLIRLALLQAGNYSCSVVKQVNQQ